MTDGVVFAARAVAQPLLSVRSLLRAPGLWLCLDPAGSTHAWLLFSGSLCAMSVSALVGNPPEQVPDSLCPVSVRALVGKPLEQVPGSPYSVPVRAFVGKPPEQAGHTRAALWERSARLCWSRSMLRRPIQCGNVPAGPSAPRCVAPVQPGMLMWDWGGNTELQAAAVDAAQAQ